MKTERMIGVLMAVLLLLTALAGCSDAEKKAILYANIKEGL